VEEVLSYLSRSAYPDEDITACFSGAKANDDEAVKNEKLVNE